MTHDEIYVYRRRQATNLETGRAPVDELDSSLSLDAGYSSLGVFGCDVATVQQCAGH
jgi:hypothetical protein